MTLVSILGDFHSSIFPILFEFKKKITHHIILHDDSKHDQKHIEKIIKAQRKFLETYEEKGIPVLSYKINRIQVAEDNYEEILNAFKVIAASVKKSKDIYLNATDGLSSIGIVLSNKVLQYGGNVISYDRYANTYNLHTKNSMEKKTIKHNMDIKNHLKLKGYELINYSSKFSLKKRKPYIQEITKNLSEFKDYANHYTKTSSHSGHYKKLINKLGNYSEQYVKGGIFEEYIYWLLKDNLKVDDIMTGVQIEFEKDVQNEIDILFIKNNHLHTIECKFSDKFKTSEYLYKTDSIMDYIDDDGKGMILTIGNKVLGYQDEARAFNDNIYFYSVKHFNKDEFLSEIKRYFEI